MAVIKTLTTLDDLLREWPKLAEHAEDAPLEHVLRALLDCLNEGVVGVVEDAGEVKGFCSARVKDGWACLCNLPHQGSSGYAKQCLEFVWHWAQHAGLLGLRVTTDRLSGSSFRYFEKTLGFRRKSVTFEIRL